MNNYRRRNLRRIGKKVNCTEYIFKKIIKTQGYGSHKLENVSKIYGTKVKITALKDVNLSIEEGEFVAIIGPSGSGKTTMLTIMARSPNLPQAKCTYMDMTRPP